MKKMKVRVPMGRTAKIQEIDLYTIEEAKAILREKDWEIALDVYSTEATNKRVGWLASFGNGDGIYVEAK